MFARLSRSIFVALLVAGLALAALPAFADTQTIVPYAADGYKYLEIGYSATPPAGFELAGFDDSAWTTGAGGFGIANGWDICLAHVLPTRHAVDRELADARAEDVRPARPGNQREGGGRHRQ